MEDNVIGKGQFPPANLPASKHRVSDAQRAMEHYRVLQASAYMAGGRVPFQSEDDGDDWVGEFCTEFANYFGLPVTNNPLDHPFSIEAGHFHKALRAALAGAYDLGYMHAEDGHENNPYW